MITETTDPSDLAQESGETGDEAAIALLMSRADQAEQQEEEEPEQQEAAEEGEEAQAEESAETEEVEDDDPEIDLGDIKLKKSELKAGYMKDADYRRKTAEAAEAKRQAQAVQEQVRQERETYANQLDGLIDSLQAQLIGDQQALAELARTDQAQWVVENAAFQQRLAAYQQAIQKRQDIANRQKVERAQAVQEWRQEQAQKLYEKLPEWKDQTKAATEQRMVAEYLLGQGFTHDEINDLYEHRSLLVAREAALWRQHQAALKSAKEKQVKPEPTKAVKPGAANQKTQDERVIKVEELRKRAQRTGKQEDIAAYLVAKSG